MGLDKGRLFTDGNYLSKEEIGAHYNLPDIEGIWKEVTEYRSLFRVSLGIANNDGIDFSAVLTRSLLSRLYGLERRLGGLLVRSVRLRQGEQEFLTGLAEAQELASVSSYYGLDLDGKAIEAIRAEKENVDPRNAVLFDYAKAQREMSRKFLGDLDEGFVDGINSLLQDLQPGEKAPVGKGLRPLLAFLDRSDDLPLFLKACFIPFWFAVAKPYDILADETSVLLTKVFLAANGFYGVAFLLPLESAVYHLRQGLQKVISLSDTSGDFTYFLNSFAVYVDQAIEADEGWMISAENIALKREREEESIRDDLGENGSPSAVDDLVAQKVHGLLESYPVLHKVQAHFLVTHCTLGKFYTVDEFKSGEKVAYETARKGMDMLAQLGFYAKSKTGKKFTYAPLPGTDKKVKGNQ